MPEIHTVRWLLDEHGGGVVKVFIDQEHHTTEHRFIFRSFSELPSDVASSIREDGRAEGEITTTRS